MCNKKLYRLLYDGCNEYKSNFNSCDFDLVENLRLEGSLQCIISILDNADINQYYKENSYEEVNMLWFCNWYIRKYEKMCF